MFTCFFFFFVSSPVLFRIDDTTTEKQHCFFIRWACFVDENHLYRTFAHTQTHTEAHVLYYTQIHGHKVYAVGSAYMQSIHTSIKVIVATSRCHLCNYFTDFSTSIERMRIARCVCLYVCFMCYTNLLCVCVCVCALDANASSLLWWKLRGKSYTCLINAEILFSVYIQPVKCTGCINHKHFCL